MGSYFSVEDLVRHDTEYLNDLYYSQSRGLIYEWYSLYLKDLRFCGDYSRTQMFHKILDRWFPRDITEIILKYSNIPCFFMRTISRVNQEKYRLYVCSDNGDWYGCYAGDISNLMLNMLNRRIGTQVTRDQLCSATACNNLDIKKFANFGYFFSCYDLRSS
jgi:hypothetical protein